MKSIGNIKLPLQRVEKVKGTDQDVLDVLFDLNIPDMNNVLHKINEADLPMLVAVNVKGIGVGLLQFKPPDIWLDFDNQKYQFHIAPNLAILHHYFVEKRMRSTDIFESEVLTKMIDWLEHFSKSQTVSHT